MIEKQQQGNDPHADGRLVTVGPRPEQADATLIFVHGRGASADCMLTIYDVLSLPMCAGVAPQAANNTWYPFSFLSPIESNQPFLDSALRRISTLVLELHDRGVPFEKMALMGFSQGACLMLEYVARTPRRYGAVIALTGGLIGPPGTLRQYNGSLEETPVFIGTSDPDPHVPLERVQESAAVLRSLGGSVEVRVYPDMPHTVNDEEILMTRKLLQGVLGRVM